MEFDFNVSRLLEPWRISKDVALLEDSALSGASAQQLRQLLDVLGEGSRRAQGLSKPVTAGWQPLCANRIYVLFHQRAALGLLKMGPKRLFVARGEKEGLLEISPLCCLDFYVVEGQQRAGLGRQLFGAMLLHEQLQAARLAYDRPSPKLLGFLRKHFGLVSFVPQANHFVVYDRFWDNCQQRREWRRTAFQRAGQSALRPKAFSPELSLVAAMAQGRL